MAVDKLLVRPYRPEDNETVKALHYLGLEQFDADAGVEDPHFIDADLDDIETIYSGNNGVFLTGMLNERIVAIGGLRRMSEACGEIKRMRVHPEYQGRGFGREILKHLLDAASSLGYRELRLDTTAQMMPARKLYEKNGFKLVRSENIGRLEVIFYVKKLA
jgi:GNAT superfamily N-acetyltransferase